MTIATIVVGPFEVNCYVYGNKTSGEALIIDPGADEKRIIDTLDHLGLVPRAILLTHGHADHIAAVTVLREKYGIPLYIGEGDQELLASPSANVSAFFDQPIVVPPADFIAADEQLITLGSLSLRVLATPGHTRGGVCYLDESEGRLFCGDTLFYGSVGRTDLPGGSYQQLISSIETKILKLPDTVVCYPGHGPKTTVGAERTNNPFLKGDYNA